jgi:hypothetical protein
LIIMWSISTELRKILILALITIGDYRLHGWSLWYRVETLVLRGRILQTRCSLVEIFNVRVWSLSLVRCMQMFCGWWIQMSRALSFSFHHKGSSMGKRIDSHSSYGLRRKFHHLHHKPQMPLCPHTRAMILIKFHVTSLY